MRVNKNIGLTIVFIICLSVFTYNFYQGYLYGKKEALNNLQQSSNTKVIKVVGGRY